MFRELADRPDSIDIAWRWARSRKPVKLHRGPMTNAFIIEPPTLAIVPVIGGGVFPMRRLVCVGRNSPALAREMGSDPTQERPFFFTKSFGSIVTGGNDTPSPSAIHALPCEAELVTTIGRGGVDIPAASPSSRPATPVPNNYVRRANPVVIGATMLPAYPNERTLPLPTTGRPQVVGQASRSCRCEVL
jgi:hypothetical protein